MMEVYMCNVEILYKDKKIYSWQYRMLLNEIPKLNKERRFKTFEEAKMLCRYPAIWLEESKLGLFKEYLVITDGFDKTKINEQEYKKNDLIATLNFSPMKITMAELLNHNADDVIQYIKDRWTLET